MNSQEFYFAGMTGHAEVVRVVFHSEQISFAGLLKVFWESHNPTQGTDTPITEPRRKIKPLFMGLKECVDTCEATAVLSLNTEY